MENDFISDICIQAVRFEELGSIFSDTDVMLVSTNID
jgi:hypothetical protein